MTLSQSPVLCPRGMNRRYFTQALLGGALGVSVALAQAPTELPKLTLLVNDSSSLTHLPVLLAEHLGFFKAEGLSVDILDQASSAMSLASLSTGGLQAWSAPYDQVLVVPRKDFLGVSIMQIGRTPQLALGVSRKTMTTFKRIPDLAGRRVGVMELDSQARRCVDYAMVLAGDSPASVQYLAMGSASHAISALRNGTVDALCMQDPAMTLLEKKGDVDIVRNFRSAKETQRLFAGPMPGNCLIVSQAMVNKHPQVCQALVSGVSRALKWLRTAGPSDLLRNMIDNPILLDRAVYLNAVDNMRESFAMDGVMSTDAAQTALRLRNVLEPQFKAARNDLGPTYTNQFAVQAKKRFAA
jgi:NitT/TauT family transport system substrate-binding protein